MKQPQDKFTLEIPGIPGDASIVVSSDQLPEGPEARIHNLVDRLGALALADIHRAVSWWRRSLGQKRRRERERWLRAHPTDTPRVYTQRLINQFYHTLAFGEIANRTYDEAPGESRDKVRVC